jgi:hypothetical protein
MSLAPGVNKKTRIICKVVKAWCRHLFVVYPSPTLFNVAVRCLVHFSPTSYSVLLLLFVVAVVVVEDGGWEEEGECGGRDRFYVIYVRTIKPGWVVLG